MRSLIFATTCFFIANISIAQTYVSLIDTGSVWFGANACDGGSPPYGSLDKTFIQGDTIYKDLTYHKLIRYLQSFYSYYTMGGTLYTEYGLVTDVPYFKVYIREDTALKRVYYINLPPDSIETLLYDFNLNVGDTLDFGSDWQMNIVHSIDTVLTANGYRRRLHIADASNADYEFVDLIEGIGSTFGLLAKLETPFECFENLICFSNQGQNTNFYSDNVLINDTTISCEFPEETISINSHMPQKFLVYPNPAGDYLNLNLPIEDHSNVMITIYNSEGRIVFQSNGDQTESEINIAEILPGIYMIKADAQNSIYIAHFAKF